MVDGPRGLWTEKEDHGNSSARDDMKTARFVIPL